MISNRLPTWVWAFVLLAAFASLWSVAARHKVESANKAVALALEWDTVASAAATSGLPIEEALGQLQEVGLKAVIIPEDTVGDALDRGDLTLVSENGFRMLMGGDGEVRAAIRRRGIVFPDSVPQGVQISKEVPMEVLRSVSLGLDADAAAQAKFSGVFLIARYSNVAGASEAYIDDLLDRAGEKGVKGFLPQGDAVLGNRSFLKPLAQKLSEHGIFYCSPEFAKMSGESTMLAADPSNVIRLHAVQAAEIERMSPREVIERYARAAGERNQRILLIRPFESTESSPINVLADSVYKVRQAVQKEGLTIAEPHPFGSPDVPILVTILTVIGILGVWAAILPALWSSRGLMIGAFAFIAAASIIGMIGKDRAPLYAATFAAIGFPILGYLGLKQWSRLHPVLQFGLISLVSVVGGLCVAGLLNGPEFYVRAESFWAVKMAHFLPIIVVGGLVVRDNYELPKLAMTPATWGALFTGVIVLFGLGFMLARTGNDNPAAVSGFELKLRSILERFFSVRPRTKEFVMGHPAMLIGLFAMAKPTKKAQSIGGLLTALGMIGQTSMVNTMCHLHTPVMVGLIRIAIGLIFGLLVGLAAWPLVRRWLPV